MEPEPWESDRIVGRTSDVVIMSSVHGRQRRAERDIDKRDLQSAIKHGTRELQPGRVRRGRWTQRVKITFAGVVYITDNTCTEEITSYAVPVLVDKIPVTDEMQLAHTRACELIAAPKCWTSHTVIVIDQSGSMKKSDIPDCSNRADAVWVCLALDWVAPQLEKGDAKATDVVSLVAMSDGATLLIKQQPLDWLLFNAIVDFRRSQIPASHGNYLPALDMAEEMFLENKFGGCALQLMFLSDGKPSDLVEGSPCYEDQSAWRRLTKESWEGLTDQHIDLATKRVGSMASRFGLSQPTRTHLWFSHDTAYSYYQVRIRSMTRRCCVQQSEACCDRPDTREQFLILPTNTMNNRSSPLYLLYY